MSSMEVKFDTLITDIKMSAGLNHQESTGFYAMHCPVCNKVDKKTGGFKFESDTIIYNCFRGSCDASCVFTLGEYVSKKFRNLMSTIHVTIPIELSIKKNSLADQIKKELESHLYEKHSFNSIKPVEGDMSLLMNQTDDLSMRWIKHFDRRKIPLEGISIIESGRYRGNCFLPFKLNGKLIGGQVITKNGYVAHNGGNEHVFYVPDGRINFETVFVVEGGMDAKCFPRTFATLRDRITKEQAFFLQGKRVIMIPDRSGGNKFPEQFHQYGWELCVPPWDVKDLNEAVIKYGVPAVYRMISENLYKDKLKATTAFRLWRMNE